MKKSSKVATQVVEQDYTKAFELSYDLGKVLAKIGEKEADIVRMRYGLNGLTPMTLNDIAKKLGLSRERIRQIEERGLLRLRRHAAKLGLIDVVARVPHPDLQPGWAQSK